MAWNIQSSRLRKVEKHLQRAGIELETAEDGRLAGEALAREVAAYELAAGATLLALNGGTPHVHSDAAVAAECVAEFSPEHWPAMFDMARDSVRRTSSDRDWPARSQALEALIAAVQARP